MVRPQSRSCNCARAPGLGRLISLRRSRKPNCPGLRCPAPHYWRLHYDEHCLVQLGQHPLQHDYHHRHPAGEVAESDALAITTKVGDTAHSENELSLSLACSPSTFAEHQWKTNANSDGKRFRFQTRSFSQRHIPIPVTMAAARLAYAPVWLTLRSMQNIYGAKQLAASFRTVRQNTIQVAEDIPEDKYSFTPAEGARPVEQTMAHIAVSTRMWQ